MNKTLRNYKLKVTGISKYCKRKIGLVSKNNNSFRQALPGAQVTGEKKESNLISQDVTARLAQSPMAESLCTGQSNNSVSVHHTFL